MKAKTLFFVFFIALLGRSLATAAVAHDHGHSHEGHSLDAKELAAGPNGGRLITSVDPHLEFLVTPERFVQITFVDHDGEGVPVDGQTVSLIGGSRSSPTKLDFVEKDGLLVSTTALPEMPNMPVIVQIKTSAEATSVREKFKLNMSHCGSCSFFEYACICGH